MNRAPLTDDQVRALLTDFAHLTAQRQAIDERINEVRQRVQLGLPLGVGEGRTWTLPAWRLTIRVRRDDTPTYQFDLTCVH